MARVLEVLLVGLALLALPGGSVQAGPLIHYQGVLLDSAGAPIDGAANVAFRLYDAASAGTLLWSESHAVTADDGVFSVLLGSLSAIEPGDFDSGARWLELQVNAETLSPRQAIASVPRALNAERLQGLSAADLSAQGGVHVPRSTQLLALDATPSVQAVHTSVTIGSDGFPIIAYRDLFASELRVVHCRSVDCGNTDPPVTVEFGTVGDNASIAIGSDGIPVIAYAGLSPALTLASCADTACTSASNSAVVDSGPDGIEASVTIGIDGFPVIAYIKNGRPWIAYCGDKQCTSPTPSELSVITADSLSIALALDGRPVIAYHSVSPDRARVAVCPASGSCIPPLSDVVVGNSGHGHGIALTIGDDGFPVMSYGSGSGVYVLRCANESCTSGGTPRLIGSASAAESHTSTSIGTDGLPIVAYYDGTAGDLKLVKCTSADCSTQGGPAVVVDGGAPDVGRFNSMAMAPDGTPIITYADSTSGVLKAAKCANSLCLSYWTRR